MQNGLKSQFWDDCGTWDTKAGSNKTALYVKDNVRKYISVVKKNHEYCLKRRTVEKVVYVPVESQPKPEDVIVIKQYYATHKKNNSFRKRVTWLENVPTAICDTSRPSILTTAVVEYIGKYPGLQPHGNSKSQLSHFGYTRTNPKVMNIISDMCAEGKRPT